MRATIRQVAERAGVSRMTVSNVLLGRTEIVTPETRAVVMRAVQELNYIPVGRPMLQNRRTETRVIAISMNDPKQLAWTINSGTQTGICEAAMKHGYDVLMLLRADPDWAADRREVQFLIVVAMELSLHPRSSARRNGRSKCW